FIKTFMMNDERNKCIDTRPGPSMRMEFDWLYSVQALCKTKEPTRYLEFDHHPFHVFQFNMTVMNFARLPPRSVANNQLNRLLVVPHKFIDLIPRPHFEFASGPHYQKLGLLERSETLQISLKRVYFTGYFQSVSSTTPPTIITALRTILTVTCSTSRKNIAAKISEKNGPVLAMGSPLNSWLNQTHSRCLSCRN